jgi:hypothetical protein
MSVGTPGDCEPHKAKPIRINEMPGFGYRVYRDGEPYLGFFRYSDAPGTKEEALKNAQLFATFSVEREESVAMLRTVCTNFGDNDWPDDLHLADVIEKHLWRHLEKKG